MRAYDPGLGVFTGVVVRSTQAADGPVTLAGRGRLRTGDGTPTRVRFVLTANPATKAVSLELTKLDGGASAGRFSGNLVNGLIKAEKIGVKNALSRP